MVEIYYGRAGCGKTYTLMQKTEQLSKEGRKTVLIVPEQLSITRETEIHSRGIKNVQVLSFTRFANTVFRNLGGTAKKHPDSAMCAAAVFCAVDSVYSELKYFKSTAYTLGFISALMSAFSEFDQNCLTEKDIMSIPDTDLSVSVKTKYRDLFLIYEKYKSLWQGEYKDPAGDIAEASALLELSDLYSDTVFAFDGFFGFTEIQLRLIAQIIQRSPLCMFAFTTDMESDVFTTVTKEVNKLCRLCKKQGSAPSLIYVGNTPHRFKTPALIEVEKHAFDMSDYASPTPLEGVRAFAAKNISEELGFVAADIKNAVLSGKYRYSDIAVLCPDADNMRFLALSVFEKHGIPIFADTSKTMLSQPLCAFVTSAFDIASRGFESEYVFSFLKTGLAGISFDDISLLENYVKIWKIRDSGWNEEHWTRNPDGVSSFSNKPDTERLDRLNRLKDRIRIPLLKFKAATSKKQSVIDFLKAVYELTEDFCIRDNLASLALEFKEAGQLHFFDEYTRVYGIFIDMLDSIASVAGQKLFDRRRFYDIISACAASVNIPGRPSRCDEVIFAKTGRARAEGKKLVYIPCMNSNIIPAVRKPSPIITDADKRVFERHDLSVSLDAQMSAYREHFDFYSAAMSPEDRLTLSYSVFKASGEALAPSEYLEAVRSAAGTEYIRREDLQDDFFLVSVAGAAEEAARTGAAALYGAIEKTSGISMRPSRQKDTTLSQSVVEGLYSRHLRLSFTGMDEYVECPFRFFIHKGLRADESKPVEFRDNDVGDYIHKGLEDMLAGDYDISTDDAVHQAINEISDNYYNVRLSDCAGRSKRFDFFFDKAKTALLSAAENVAAEVRASDFKPQEFEVEISDYGKPVTLKNGYTLTLVGKIDRVDRTDDGYAKIVDYKSGKQTFSFKDIYNGISMQLPIYASAIKAKDPDVKIAAMYYLKVGVPNVTRLSSEPMSDEQYLSEIDACYKRDGVFSTADGVIERLDSRGKLFAKVKDERLMSDSEINKLIDFAKERIQRSGEGITSGCTDISPLTANACKYCKYKAICKIEDGDERIRKLEDMPERFFKEDA